jgi:tRNA G18 (ribose-2'-O)-methylase SpoU
VVEACERAVTIPQRAGAAESLNLAAAAAIVLQGISSRAPVAVEKAEGEPNG